MFRRSVPRRIADPSKDYANWPWPKKLPLKPHWYRHLSTGPEQSISQEVRRVQTAGDFAVVATIGFVFWRVWTNIQTGAYKTRLMHTTGMPPALVAQEIDFAAGAKNRTVSRQRLDEYREEFATARGKPVESFIFKY